MGRSRNSQTHYEYDAQAGRGLPIRHKQVSRGRWVGGEWFDMPQPGTISKGVQTGQQSPIVIEDDTDSDCYEVPPPATQRVNTDRISRNQGRPIAPAFEPLRGPFDFNNSEHPLPWATRVDETLSYKVGTVSSSSFRIDSGQVRSFAETADNELLAYLAARSVSTGFLVEIDQFLSSRPEIATYPEGRDTILQLNALAPLEA